METPSANRGPIKETVKKTIEFPEKDESVGELMISYMGPKSDEFLESKASSLSFISGFCVSREVVGSPCLGA